MTSRIKNVKFLTYSQMVENLKKKNLTIVDKKIAIELIKAKGYYNLINRYKNHVYNQNGQYPNHTHLTDLFLFQTMEADLQDILFQATINFEHRFKEAIAHILSTQLGISEADYLDPLRFKKRKFNKAIKITAFLLEIAYHTDKNPTRYYRKNYDCIPPWILLNNITLGQARMLFSIFNSKMTTEVISSMLPIEAARIPSLIVGKTGIDTLAIKQLLENGYDDIFGMYHQQTDKKIREINTAYKRKFDDITNLFKNMLSIIHDFRT